VKKKDLQNLQGQNSQSIHLDRQQSLPQLVTHQSQGSSNLYKKQSTESQTILETGASQMGAWCIKLGRLSDKRNLSSQTENGQAMAVRTRLPPRMSRNLARPTRAARRIDSRSSSSNNTGNVNGKEKVQKSTNHGNLPIKSPTGNQPLLQTDDTEHH
jgi:hypothetical protein